jgi:hypothetical protein
MKNKIKEFFEPADFIVSETDFTTLPIKETLRLAILEMNKKSSVGIFLYFFPDLFIFPRKIPAVNGCFFGVIVTSGNLPDERAETLNKHFPVDRIAIFTELENQIKVRWMNDSSTNFIELDEFISSLKKNERSKHSG